MAHTPFKMPSPIAIARATSKANAILGQWPLILMIIVPLALWPSTVALLEKWLEQGRYSHGPLIAAMAAYAIYVTTRRPRSYQTRPSIMGFVALGLALSVWILFRVGDIQTAHVSLLPIVLLCGVYATAGYREALRLAVPIGLLVFGMPIWEPIATILQYVSVHVVGTSLRVFGLPVAIDGVLVMIPAGTFAIESGCSGIAYFMVALSIAVFLCVIERQRIQRSLAIVLCFGITAALSNWIRILTIIVAGQVTEMRSSLVSDHYAFGWLLFAAVFAPVAWYVMQNLVSPAAAPTESVANSGANKSALAACIFLIAALPWVARAGVVTLEGKLPTPADPALPMSGFANDPGPANAEWSPTFPGAATSSMQRYLRRRESYFVYRANYQAQTNGSELVGTNSSLAGEAARGVRRIAEPRSVAPAGSRQARPGILQWVATDGTRWTASYLYRIGPRVTGSDAAAKVLQLLSIGQKRDVIGIVAVGAQCSGSCERERDGTTALLHAAVATEHSQ